MKINMKRDTAFKDKFMLVDRRKEDEAITSFYDSYLGLSQAMKDYTPSDLPNLIVLKRRHDHAISWRSVDIVPKFRVSIGSGVSSHFYLELLADPTIRIPFPVPRDSDLADAIAYVDMEQVYEVVLSDYTPMLTSLDLIHDFDPIQ